jgi:hypothetical protein
MYNKESYTMIKKLLLMITPVLVLAAFVVIPAFAQVKAKAAAETKAYGTCETGEPQTSPPCPEGEKNFKAFTTSVKVTGEKAAGTGNLVLTDTVTGAKVECGGQTDTGTDKNIAGVGESTLTSISRNCFTLIGTTKCKVNTPGAGAGFIVGTMTGKVLAGGLTVRNTVAKGFEPEFSGTPAGCPAAGTEFGTVTGSATGTVAKGSNVLVAANATGILLGTDAVTITGSLEFYTEGTGKPVVIN